MGRRDKPGDDEQGGNPPRAIELPTQRSLRLEAIVVGLILLEVALTLVQMAMGGG